MEVYPVASYTSAVRVRRGRVTKAVFALTVVEMVLICALAGFIISGILRIAWYLL